MTTSIGNFSCFCCKETFTVNTYSAEQIELPFSYTFALFAELKEVHGDVAVV